LAGSTDPGQNSPLRAAAAKIASNSLFNVFEKLPVVGVEEAALLSSGG